jgi:hypothetical protein
MWADLRRYDIKVANIDNFADTIYTSKHQKTMNDWPGKQIFPINDQHYVDDNWVFGCGYLNNKDPSIENLFDSYYKNTDKDSQYFTSYCRMLSLQGFLKSIKQPYLFVSTRQLVKLNRFQHLYNQLDFDRIVNDISIFDFSKKLNSWDLDQIHPGPAAHQAYCNHLLQYIEKRNLFLPN